MKTLTRRHVLRGAGVALALPWLESLAPRFARGQAAPRPRRFIPIYFPMGTASYWAPTAAPGLGAAWELSPILEPLAPVKSHVTVLRHVDNTAYGASALTPPFARETGAFLTCVPATPGMPPRNGISVDQVIANGKIGERPPLHSLQVGLSTLDSPAEDLPVWFSRSISWKGPVEPLGRIIDPQGLFDRLTASSPVFLPRPAPDPAADARRATSQSVLDFVLDDAAKLQPRLAATDRRRVDQFLTSVRAVEKRIQPLPPPPPGCALIPRPTDRIALGKLPPGYSRDAHADVMIDLMALALTCDVTRVISLMLDDAHSEFVYDFLQQRIFTATGSTPGTAPIVDDYHRLTQSAAGLTGNAYATINRWFVTKVAALCQRLASVPTGPDSTLLDDSVVWFGSGMHDAQATSLSDLPVLYVGGGGGVLKQGAHLDLGPGGRLSDVYLTFIQKVFGLPDTQFADSQGIVPALLA